MLHTVIHVFEHAVKITLLVFVMMVAIDLLNVWTRGKLTPFLQGSAWRQYLLASFLGATPGCAGAYMNVSLYVHGLISFGALVGGMVATSGDEAFLMIVMFPREAFMLFGLLFGAGVIFSWITDKIVRTWNIRLSYKCELHQHHPDREGLKHYMLEHIWQHIIKRHIWKIFLWVLGAMLIIDIALYYGDITALSAEYTVYFIFAAALIGIIPQSGPNIVFITMFAHGIIPFSVLFTSSFIQDGHALLPMLSYSVRDTVIIKGFNLVFGLGAGLLIYFAGW
jgi:hypothetical protein